MPEIPNPERAMDTIDHVAAQRSAIADLVDGFDDEQWTTPSLCEGWEVRHVIAHLGLIWSVSIPKLLVAMVRHRGYDRANLHLSRRLGERPKDELVTDLRAHARHAKTPPGLPLEAMLTDVVVHARDITIPLSLPFAVPDEVGRRVLDFVMSKKGAHFWPEGGIDALHFVATDADWSHGTGPEVRGTSADLATALQGRPAVVDHLEGDGVTTFASRFR